MNIMTRNLGLYSYMKYWRHIHNLISDQQHIDHEFYNTMQDSLIHQTISDYQPDHIIFQEISQTKDFLHLQQVLPWYSYSSIHHSAHPSGYHTAIFSQHKCNYSTDSTKQVFSSTTQEDITIIPVHLHAFSAQRRYQQISAILQLIQDQHRSKYCIIGDYNMWQFWKRFLFKYDKKSYHDLLQVTYDSWWELWATTTIGAKLDKIMCAPILKTTHIQILNIRWTYMDHYPLLATII